MQSSQTTSDTPSGVDDERTLQPDGKPAEGPAAESDACTVEKGPEPVEFEVPDGGLTAWVTVAGAWLCLFSTFGFAFTFGVYEDYYVRVYLTDHSPSSIAWIGSFQLMMPFFCGPLAGKLFDMGYFHEVEIVGGIIFTISAFLLSLAKQNHYYQIFLAQGVGMGLGVGLIFLPSLSITVHHFKRHRALASGIIMSGTSLGATLFPIMLNHWLPKYGFARAVRYSSAIVPPCLVAGNLMMKKRLPPRPKNSTEPQANILSFFKDVPYIIGTFGMLFGLLGLFFTAIYIQLYGVTHKVDTTMSFYSISILNATGLVVRIAGNRLADTYGPFNAIIIASTVSGALIWAILGVKDRASLIVVSIIYGAASSAWLALTFPAFASLARGPEEVGARLGIALFLTSFSVLGSSPIQGSLLGTTVYRWIHPVAFSATTVFVSAILFFIARIFIFKTRDVKGWKV
ncbi:hypothetical protein HMN09_01010600 [Mycena chlorophos]|uniref:MFS general substrate transporter n=1 Tax=Mycena chlorophos TaxID=658473 RepID=A0A8H6SEC0_MYCCL|nr:hypothetical protein HMN09_01010600 [Mycena chlorophos]